MKWVIIIALYLIGWVLYGSLAYSFSRRDDKTEDDDNRSTAVGCLCGMFWPVCIFLSLIIECIKRVSMMDKERTRKTPEE